MPDGDLATYNQFSLSHFPVNNTMDFTPLVCITDDLYEIIDQQTAVFRMLYTYFSTHLTDPDYAEIVIEYFQHICFQMSLMRKPATPELRFEIASLDNFSLDSFGLDSFDLKGFLDNSKTICTNLGELTDEKRKRGIKAFTAFLEEEKEDLVAHYLYPALSGYAPSPKFFKPAQDVILETLKDNSVQDEGLGQSPTPSNTEF